MDEPEPDATEKRIRFGCGAALGALVALPTAVWVSEATRYATVVAMLVTGLVFSPVRDKTQGFVDKRFYRDKVDARKAFAEFGRALRRTVDLGEALAFVVVRVSTHMHAAHAAVFQHAKELALQSERHVADFVQEQRPFVRMFEASGT